jgi:hypothetical protein
VEGKSKNLRDLLSQNDVLPLSLKRAWDDFCPNLDLHYPRVKHLRGESRIYLVKNTSLGKALAQAATMMGAKVEAYDV